MNGTKLMGRTHVDDGFGHSYIHDPHLCESISIGLSAEVYEAY